MTNFLRKIFIRNFNDVTNPKIRKKHGLLAAFTGAFTNLLLCIFKIIIGILVGSMTIIADAINNLTDMGSCFANVIGFILSGKPADKEHPFGHERIEYIAGLIIAFIIIFLAALLGYTSVNRIINHDYTIYSNQTFIIAIVILTVSILVKLWQGMFYKNISKLINSISLKASAQDSINDVITTSVVLIATILEFALQKYNVHLDAYFSIGVAIFIVIMGIKLIIETSDPLIGVATNNEYVKKALSEIKQYPGVLGIHDVMCHSYGPTKIFMTLHVEVDSKVDVLVSHDMIDIIENQIGNKYNMLVTIHMDPIDTRSPLVNETREKTKLILENYSKELTFHDFRMVIGETHTNVLFDVVIPFESKINAKELTTYLREELKKIDPLYVLVVKIDNDYMQE